MVQSDDPDQDPLFFKSVGGPSSHDVSHTCVTIQDKLKLVYIIEAISEKVKIILIIHIILSYSQCYAKGDHRTNSKGISPDQ